MRCRTCDGFPCYVGAKSDAETCAVDPALATGKARLLTGVRVRRIVTDRTGRRVDHLVADGPDGAVEVRGERFVLAAGAASSAALLLGSADDRHPRGLANSSDQVGRRFMMHNNAHVAAVDVHRRNDVDVPEDAVGQRLVPRRRRRLAARVAAADRQGAGRDDEELATRVPLAVLDRRRRAASSGW